MSKQLTIKQEKFCQTYLLTGNATEAYRTAYNCSNMKSVTINRKAAFLLKLDNIRARIEKVRKETYERNKATIDEVISVASDMLRADISEAFDENGNLLNIKKIPKSLRMAIAGVESTELTSEGSKIGNLRKVKMSDRTKLIDMFFRHYGEYAKDNEQKRNAAAFIDVSKLPDDVIKSLLNASGE